MRCTFCQTRWLPVARISLTILEDRVLRTSPPSYTNVSAHFRAFSCRKIDYSTPNRLPDTYLVCIIVRFDSSFFRVRALVFLTLYVRLKNGARLHSLQARLGAGQCGRVERDLCVTLAFHVRLAFHTRLAFNV